MSKPEPPALDLDKVTAGPQAGGTLAEVRRIGLQAQMVDPGAGGSILRVPAGDRTKVMRLHAATENYTELLRKFSFGRYLWNSVFITLVATAITLLANSMAAFGLSKFRFPGREPVFLLMLATLMVPPTIVLVPNYLIAAQLGLVNSSWGVIWPAIATPTGVFLLRQYMLTLPDDLIEAARMDNASEWRIYWRIVLPLSAPALAVLAIFSVMWRWNEVLWPMVVLDRSESFTLPLALNASATPASAARPTGAWCWIAAGAAHAGSASWVPRWFACCSCTAARPGSTGPGRCRRTTRPTCLGRGGTAWMKPPGPFRHGL